MHEGAQRVPPLGPIGAGAVLDGACATGHIGGLAGSARKRRPWLTGAIRGGRAGGGAGNRRRQGAALGAVPCPGRSERRDRLPDAGSGGLRRRRRAADRAAGRRSRPGGDSDHRADERIGALVHGPALREEPGCSTPCARPPAWPWTTSDCTPRSGPTGRGECVARSHCEATDAERRRVERNLHDRAQQRLVTLSLALTLARSRLANETTGTRASPASTSVEVEGVAQVLAEPERPPQHLLGADVEPEDAHEERGLGVGRSVPTFTRPSTAWT